MPSPPVPGLVQRPRLCALFVFIAEPRCGSPRAPPHLALSSWLHLKVHGFGGEKVRNNIFFFKKKDQCCGGREGAEGYFAPSVAPAGVSACSHS